MNPLREPTRIPIVFNEDPEETTVSAAAMSAARVAQARWARSPLAHRLGLVRRLRRLIALEARALAEASASARKRPMAESLAAEVLPLAEACRFLERNAAKILSARRLGRRGLPFWLAQVRCEIHREPFGVVLIIGPGNYPLLLPGVQMVQALVAGNAVLLKPGVGGGRVAGRLRDLMVRAGLDSQLVGLLPESTAAVHAAIAAHPDKVLFTGSAGTGEKILTALAPHLIPATMELSGCDAVIIRSDADLDLAAKALKFGLKLNAGATCLSPKRVFVARSIATELEGRLARMLNTPGSRGNEAHAVEPTDQCLLTSAPTVKLRPMLDDALAQGAHFVAGGFHGDGAIDLPVVLAGVSPMARLLREDVFAPVLALVTVADDNEAVLRANACPFALGAAIFSGDMPLARALAGRVHAGVVSINDLIIPTADARLPFGGRKRSGFGVTRGADGLLELTTPKVVTATQGRFRPAFEPPHPADAALFQAYLKLVHGRGVKSRGAGLISLIQNILQRRKSSSKETP
jgi:acyl-CoA reductase-like NAD-dependent aldehyde dehydrogenase